jgi:hypothetical protein
VPKLATLAADRRTQRPLARWSARRARAVAISLHMVRRERHPGIRPRRLPQRRVLARVRTHRIPKTTPPPTPPTTPPPPKPPTTPQPKRPHRRRNLRPHRRRRNVRPHTSDNTTADTSDNTNHRIPDPSQFRQFRWGRNPAKNPRAFRAPLAHSGRAQRTCSAATMAALSAIDAGTPAPAIRLPLDPAPTQPRERLFSQELGARLDLQARSSTMRRWTVAEEAGMT